MRVTLRHKTIGLQCNARKSNIIMGEMDLTVLDGGLWVS